jgi:hypothetical protein
MRSNVLRAAGRFLPKLFDMQNIWIQEPWTPVDDRSDYEAHLNRSLDDVIALLEREIRRLRESLETYRLSSHPDRQEIIRWHVRTLDERQDALEQLRTMLTARQDEDGDQTRH